LELRDLIVTPAVIILVYVGAFIFRPRVTDEINRGFFLPALTLRIIGALAVGVIYQFYYSGGDTFNFHTSGSRHIWEAFWDSPSKGIQMLLSSGKHQENFYAYSSRIYFFSDPASFMVIRVAALLDLFTFSTYSATAVLFAVISFVGSWMLFLTFYNKYPELYRWIAAGTLFIPSVFFWGSGLLKDTLVLAALGIATFELDRLLIRKRISVVHVLLLLLSLYLIFTVKKFLLQAYLPAVILWIYMGRIQRIRTMALKVMAVPFVLVLCAVLAYYSVIKVGEGDTRYAAEKLSQTARITAMDIRYQTGREAGSGYSLGDLDGSFMGMLRLAPKAINVSLFRPYLWEVRNPLMLLSALESAGFLFLVLYVVWKKRTSVLKKFTNPDIAFTMVFSLVFAFAVGVSTFNFGSLARYKIPLLPFFFIGLALILHSNSDKKTGELDDTE
jgi:hypothetical protein